MTQTRYDHCPTCAKDCADVEYERDVNSYSYDCNECGAEWQIELVCSDHIIIKKGEKI